MLGRFAALAVCVSLAACANLEPAGRNATRGPEPSRPPAAATPAPAPARAPAAAPLPAPVPATAAPAPSSAPLVTTQPRASEAAPVASTPAPRAAPAAASPAPAAASAPSRQGTFTPDPQDDEVVVPGQRDRQITPPSDWRSASERMEDLRAWDQCVTRVQAAYERDPMRPQLDSPEQYCARSLGMSDRDAIPISRQERRR